MYARTAAVVPTTKNATAVTAMEVGKSASAPRSREQENLLSGRTNGSQAASEARRLRPLRSR